MSTMDLIYDKIKSKFKKRTNLDIAEGSVLDSFVLSSSAAIEEAYKEIEKNKTPHIYTSLKGDNLDGLGLLVGCNRSPNESDSDYLYRIVRWNKNNQASNITAIENALLNMKYSSNCKFVPHTLGIGTATVYIIPKDLSEETSNNAMIEAKERLKNITSAKAYVEYVIPEALDVIIHAYIKASKNMGTAKDNIEKDIKDYINNIKPGEHMKIGIFNKIGNNENNIEYFSVSNVIVNGKEVFDTSIIQKLEKKFVFNNIVWNEVE